MWELDCEKAECQRIDAFELWCWRRVLKLPWTARRSNQSILKEISLEYSLEGLMSWNSHTLATWCEELTHLKRRWCWEILKAGRKGGNRGWDGWMASLVQWTWVWVSSGSWWWTGRPGMLQSVGLLKRVRHDWETELTELMAFPVIMYGYEIWLLNVEHRRIDVFDMWSREDTWQFLGQQEYQTNQS